jgi:hypothetical protein
MRSRSHPLILAALLAAAATQSTLLSAFQANQAPAKDDASLDCTDAKEPCGLPGPDIGEIRRQAKSGDMIPIHHSEHSWAAKGMLSPHYTDAQSRTCGRSTL